MNAAKLNMETQANNEWMDGERKKSFLKLDFLYIVTVQKCSPKHFLSNYTLKSKERS